MELQIDLTELFEPEGYNATEWKKNKYVESHVRIVATVMTTSCEKCLPVV